MPWAQPYTTEDAKAVSAALIRSICPVSHVLLALHSSHINSQNAAYRGRCLPLFQGFT